MPRADAIRVLLHNGADLAAATEKEQQTALHLAALHGHLHLSQYLVNSGACVNVSDAEGNTPLHFAVQQAPRPALGSADSLCSGWRLWCFSWCRVAQSPLQPIRTAARHAI